MSDRQPPNGGPGPFDGWDLDALLTGEDVWLPEGMRLVEAALDALRSAATAEEVADEATARAVFRDVMRAGDGAVSGGARHLAGRATAGGAHVVTRSRHAHRRPRRTGGWRSGALAGGVAGSAAVLLVGGMTLAGVFPGVGRSPGAGHQTGTASATPHASHSGANGLDGTATAVPTTHPTPSASVTTQPSAAGASPSPNPAQLCLKYLNYLVHPGDRAHREAEQEIAQQLSRLAGGRWQVGIYCVRLQPWEKPQESGGFTGMMSPQWPQARRTSSTASGRQQADEQSQRNGNPAPGGARGNSASPAVAYVPGSPASAGGSRGNW